MTAPQPGTFTPETLATEVVSSLGIELENVDVSRDERGDFVIKIRGADKPWMIGTADAIRLAACVASILGVALEGVTAKEVRPGQFEVLVNGELFSGTFKDAVAWAEQWAREIEKDPGFEP